MLKLVVQEKNENILSVNISRSLAELSNTGASLLPTHHLLVTSHTNSVIVNSELVQNEIN